MQFHLYKMTLQGRIAVAILALIGLSMATYLVLFPKGYVTGNDWRHQVMAVLGVMSAILSCFPIGWLGWMLGDGGFIEGIVIIGLFMILNAYLWAYTIAAIVRRVKRQLPWTPPPDGPIQPGR